MRKISSCFHFNFFIFHLSRAFHSPRRDLGDLYVFRSRQIQFTFSAFFLRLHFFTPSPFFFIHLICIAIKLKTNSVRCVFISFLNNFWVRFWICNRIKLRNGDLWWFYNMRKFFIFILYEYPKLILIAACVCPFKLFDTFSWD